MNEIGYKSMSAASFNQDNISKLFSDTLSRIPESTFATSNNFTIADVETKEITSLKRTVNRLEKNISFIQYEHNQMLKGLQNQVDKLREENQELQFQLVMRSSRNLNDETQLKIKIPSPDFFQPMITDSESLSNQILELKMALKEEKALNSELIMKLDSLQSRIHEVKDVIEEMPAIQVRHDDEIDISSKIRISLEPLTVSLYHEDSGQFIKNSSPTRDDCEIIIKALLERPRLPSANGNTQNINTKPSHNIPIIRKPLQIIKQYPRNSASIKLNPLHGTFCSKPIELIASNHQKLSPIVSQKNDIINSEGETQRPNISRQSDLEYPKRNLDSCVGDRNMGSSLPALPKPTEYNQAEKQRRLQMLQKKRLDQYNSKH